MAPFSKIPENLLASAPPHTTPGTVPAVAYWGGEAGLSASVAAFPRKAGGWIHRVGHRRCTCAAIPIPSRFTIIPASSARPPAPARKPTLTGPNHWTCTLVQKNHLQPSLIQSQHVILCPRTRRQSAWHLQRKSQRIYWHPHHLVRHRGQSPRARRWACTRGRWLDGRIVTNRRVPRNRNDCAVAGDSPRSRRHRGNEGCRGRGKGPVTALRCIRP